jgi:hypothetical protein
MARRFEVDKINLDAYEIEPFINEKYVGFVIKWDSDIGFGEYTIYKAVGSDKWQADSEHMDKGEDKAFLNELLKLFVGSLEITD